MTPETVTPSGSWLSVAAFLTAAKPPSVCLIALTQRSKCWTRESRREAISAAFSSSLCMSWGMGDSRCSDGEADDVMADLMLLMSLSQDWMDSRNSACASYRLSVANQIVTRTHT